VFLNALEIKKMEKHCYLFYEPGKEIPFAKQTYRIKGSFRENLELWDFPLDYQVLYINLFFLLFFVSLLTAFQQHMNSAHSLVSVFHCHQLIIVDLSADVYFKRYTTTLLWLVTGRYQSNHFFVS